MQLRPLFSLLLLSVLSISLRGQDDCGFGLRGFGGVRTGSTFKGLHNGEKPVTDVAVQPDGKILVLGEHNPDRGYDFGVTRFLPDGQLDETFGPDGTGTATIGWEGTNDGARAIVVLRDGRIVIAGGTAGSVGVACLHEDGRPNANFGGGDGMVETDWGDKIHAVSSMALAPDGSIYVVADHLDVGLFRNDWDVLVSRYDQRGNPDTRFDKDGKKRIALGDDEVDGHVQALAFDRVMVAGNFLQEGRFFVVRYHGSGAPDETLGIEGKREYDGRYADLEGVVDFVAVDDGASWIVTSHGLYALESNGQPKQDFGDHPDGGSVALDRNKIRPRSLVRLADGRLIVAGTAESGTNEFALLCFLENGELDTSFGNGGYVRQSVVENFDFEDNFKAMAVAPDGKLMLAGTMQRGGSLDTALMRLYDDGELDQDCREDDTPTGEVPGGDRDVKMPFRRADANTNCTVDLTDVIYTLEFLFIGNEEPTCMDALDANDDATVDLSDATRTLSFLFLGKEAPPAPFESCGVSARSDGPGCTSFDTCDFRAPTKDLPSGAKR